MDELTSLGLTGYEKNAYLTLLKHNQLTGTNTSRKSRVPYGKIYQTLDSLERKGLISTTNLRPKLFSAINPNIAVENYVQERINQLKTIKENLIPQLEKIRKEEQQTTSERVKVIYGRKRQWAFVEHFYNITRENIKLIFSYEVRPESVRKALYDCIDRGVNVKLLATKKTSQGLKWMKEDIKHGAKVKYYPIEELRLAVRDHCEARLQIVNPKNPEDRIGVYIQSLELARALEHYFDSIWDKADEV